MLCILYVTLLGASLGLIGLLVEQALPPTAPRRWIWCLVIALSTVLPPLYRARHTASVSALAPSAAVTGSGHRGHGPAFGAAWWTRVDAYGGAINRVWLFSSVLLLVLGVVSMGRVSYLVRRAKTSRAALDGPAVVDGVPVVLTESLGPATVGLLRSRVVVPRWVLALPGVQRGYVLRHEEEHRRANDSRVLFLASLPLLLLPWSLPLWWQLRRLQLAIEMDCDNRVVAALGDARAYGSLLLKVAEAGSRGPRLQPAFLGGVGTLERRLTRLLATGPRGHVRRYLAPAAAVVLLLLVLSMPHPVADAPPRVVGAAATKVVSSR